MSHSVQIDIHGLPFSIETGKVAKQADGAVVVRFGASMVLATVVGAKSAREGQDFFPLTVEYRERAYAGGRIPGGYFKREGAPVKKEILTCRLIDRPIRPLFPDGFRNEIQVICLVISGDPAARSRRPGDERRLRRALPSPAFRSAVRSAPSASASSTASSSPIRRRPSRKPRRSSSSWRAPRTPC